jgi:two-component system sensor histidine kinase PilS (NtrC family)
LSSRPAVAEGDGMHVKLKWLIFFRLLFTLLLMGSTVALHIRDGLSFKEPSLIVLYGLIVFLLTVSFCYAVLLKRFKKTAGLTYVQIVIDTVAISLIIFLTGSFSSLFFFLYLVVIMYAGILLYRKGGLIMAALCSIQYGILIDLEFYGVLSPMGRMGELTAADYAWSYVLYKVMIIMAACFVVAFLTGIIAEQERDSRKELAAMASYTKRVEIMAAVGEMAAGLAHEIRNPLASLIGSVQLLKEDSLDGHGRGHRKLMLIVLREADRLSSLVNNFLLFAKPPAGRREVINLGGVVSETSDIFDKNTDLSQRITISRRIEAGIWVEMDPGQLRQVFWNLLLNAVESIENDGAINIEVRETKRHTAVVTIEDTGCGIPTDKIDAVFDPFMTTKPKGTGLGLSIVHRIMETHGCRLDVESVVGKGTIFTLTFTTVDPSTILKH